METVTRFVVTHIGPGGDRIMSAHRQGRYTYATREEAQASLDNMLKNSAADTLLQVHGPKSPGTYNVQPCRCYPNHFDPCQYSFGTI